MGKTTRSTTAAIVAAVLFCAAHAHAAALTNRLNLNSVILPDGDVYLIGGQTGDNFDTAVSTVQRVQQDNLGNVITEPNLAVARTSFTATLLATGDILIAGGRNGGGTLNTFEIYSPKLNCGSAATADANLGFRYAHTATLLKDATLGGQVLVCGGKDNNAGGGNVLSSCALYQPGLPLAACGGAAPGNFIAGPTMTTSRAAHSAILLRDGRVWLAGGVGIPCAANCSTSNYVQTTELFTPAGGGGFFVAGRPLLAQRAFHVATMMGDGRVLVAGGLNDRDVLANRGFLSSTEIYDPISNSIVEGNPMNARKAMMTSALDVDGEVLIYGGLGNVTTTFFNPSGNLDLITKNDSFITTAFNPSNVLTTGTITGGSLHLTITAQLGTGVTGVIENGAVLFSTPTVTFPGGEAFLMPGTPSKAFGLQANLAGTYLYCTPPNFVALFGPSGSCGNFSSSYSLNNVSGQVVFFPTTVSPSNMIVTIGHVTFPGTLSAGNAQINLADDGSSFMFGGAVTITLPLNFAGGTVTTGYIVLNGANFLQPSSYTIQFTSLVGVIPAFTAINNNGTNATITFNPVWTNPQGQITYAGVTGNNTFAGSVNPPEAGTSGQVSMSGMGGVMTFESSRVDVSGNAFAVDIATIVIDAMEFGDEERYQEAGPSANQWLFGWRGTAWGLNATSFIGPTGDFDVFGGAACGYVAGVGNCGTVRSAVPFGELFTTIPKMGGWSSGGSLNQARANHTTTQLPDNTILAAGGTNGPNVLATAETFDPFTGQVKATMPMSVARDLHTATLLVNGRVLAAGGFATTAASTGATATAEMYFPNSRVWIPVESMSTPRENHTATLLGDGRVLVAGGYANGVYLQSIEIFDPVTGHWTRGKDMSIARALHQATLLQDGRVLVTLGVSTAGVLATNEIYNPTTDAWAGAAALPGAPSPRLRSHRANLMFNGKVLLTGGDDGFGETNSSFLYDPVGNSWTDTGTGGGTRLQVARTEHAAVVLPNGNVVVSGGAQISLNNALNSVETFDVSQSSWQIAGNAATAHVGHGLVLSPVAKGFGSSRGNLFTLGGAGVSINGLGNGFVQNSIDQIEFQGRLDAVTLNESQTLRVGSITSVDLNPFDHGSTITLRGFNFEGETEGNMGDGVGNADQYHPRVVLQALDNSGGVASQGNGGFALDLTRFIYQTYSGNATNNWTKTDSSITITMPGAATVPAPTGDFVPYGWYQLRTAANSQFSNAVILQSGPPLPGALASPVVPAGVGPIFAGVGSSSISWTWGASAGASGYDIYTASSMVFISTSQGTSFTVTGLVPNTQASIAVAGFNLSGDGPLSTSGTFYTYAAPPTLVSVASITFNSVLLQWSTNGNAPGTVYEVTMSIDNPAPGGNGQQPFTTNVSTPVPAVLNNTTNFALINFLAANTTYSFRVQAYNGAGLPSGFTLQANAAPPFSQVYISTRTRVPITSVAGTAQDTASILWTWSNTVPPINPGAGEFFKVYNATASTAANPVVLVTTGAPAYLDVVNGTDTPRQIAVSAVTSAGEGPLTLGPTVYTLAAIPALVIPSIAPSSISTGSLSAVWGANGNPIYVTYNLVATPLYGAGGGGTITAKGLNGSFGNLAPPNSIFDVRVNAQNEQNIPTAFISLGQASFPQVFTTAIVGTTATFANPPTQLAVTGSNSTSISFNWSRNGNNPNFTFYEVTYTTAPDFTSNPGAVHTAIPFSSYNQVTTATISGLITGTTYSIRVQAENIFGVPTAYSNVITTSPFNGGGIPGTLTGVILAGQNNEIIGYVGGPTNPRLVHMVIPIGSLPVGTVVTISSQSFVPSPCGANGTAIGVNIVTNPPVQPTGPVYLTLGYTAAEVAGLDMTKLAVQRIDPAAGCVPLSTTNDPIDMLLTAQLNHFTGFQAGLVLGSASVDDTLIFPNPFYPSRGQGYVTFANTPANSHIRIFTMRGELVNENYTNGSGIWIWGGTNLAGRNVASGVYMAVVEAGDAKRIFKVVVLR